MFVKQYVALVSPSSPLKRLRACSNVHDFSFLLGKWQDDPEGEEKNYNTPSQEDQSFNLWECRRKLRRPQTHRGA